MLTDEDKEIIQQAEEELLDSCREEAAQHFNVTADKLSYKKLEEFYWVQQFKENTEEQRKEAEFWRTSAGTALGVECDLLSHDDILLWKLEESFNSIYARLGDEIVYFKE